VSRTSGREASLSSVAKCASTLGRETFTFIYIKVPVKVVITYPNTHSSLLHSVIAEGDPAHDACFAESAVVIVHEKQAGSRIAGDGDVRPTIFIEVRCDHGHSMTFAGSEMKGYYHMLPLSCTDTAFPSNSTVVSNFSGTAMPTPFDSLTRTIRNVLCSNIPGKLPRRSPTVNVEALSSQCRGMMEYAPCS
jgi:hypothetical protein